MVCTVEQCMILPDIYFDVGRDDLSVSLIGLDNVVVAPSKNEWIEFEHVIFERIRGSITLADVKDEPIFRSYRDLYWTFGMDPTKERVSSEALLRRILNGLNLWSVSNLVDVANLSSAYHKIPIGLIDANAVNGELHVRIAKKEEEFVRIGGKRIHCRGREIVLADDEKIVCFGYATHDSEFTKVSVDTNQVLVLLYGAPEVAFTYMESATNDTVQMITPWVACNQIGTRFFRSSIRNL